MAFRLVGYGSLLSPDSMAKTIAPRRLTPVTLKGYRRVYNLATRFDDSPNVLNVEKDPDGELNAVIFEVDDEEIKELAKREAYYNIEEVEVFDFETGNSLGTCMIFVDVYISLDREGRKPFKPYFMMVRNAAYSYGERFGKMFDETTFTSSGEKLSDWLEKNQEYDCFKTECSPEDLSYR